MNNLTKNVILFPFNLLYFFSPALDLKILFRIKQGYKLNLKHPKTYSEKLQWIKLNDKNPLMTKCCDKYAVRAFVENQGCGEILNRLIWEGFDPGKIPFDSLPDKFVIKITHGSTFNIICTDRLSLNRSEVVRKCEKWLQAKFLPCYGEWFYGVEPPRVIIEEYIESDDGQPLRDYKVYCFRGKPEYIALHSDRFGNHKKDIYDCNWHRLEGKYIGYIGSEEDFPKPVILKELLDCAEKLSSPFLHARVDFYIVGRKLYFGEITFTPGAGFDKFSSYEFDLEFGNHLILDK